MMPCRLMVGHMPLEHSIMVRIHARQPEKVGVLALQFFLRRVWKSVTISMRGSQIQICKNRPDSMSLGGFLDADT